MKKIILLLIMLLILSNISFANTKYDIVIKNGLIYDPLSGKILEKFNIGILTDKIEIITRNNIEGSIIIDANNKYVFPGFIDMFQRHYGEIFESFRLKDGVTSSIYISDEKYDVFIANNSENISYINRILLFDISNSIPNTDDKNSITIFLLSFSKFKRTKYFPPL